MKKTWTGLQMVVSCWKPTSLLGVHATIWPISH